MKKQIIFFDGDGTLWYPHATKWSRKPFWVYYDELTKGSHLDHLILTPQAVETLKLLRTHNIKTVILSTHPHEAVEAAAILNEKVRHFKVEELFDEVIATPEYPEAKGEKILDILKSHNLKVDDALMVGDSYVWDYLSAQVVGVDAVLINSDYHQENIAEEPVERQIDDLDGLRSLLDLA